MANIVDQNGLYVEEFNISRMTLDQVNIKPSDISPKELKDTVENLNRSLNEKAMMKRPETLENLRNRSPDLQRVREANADHRLHHRFAGGREDP